MRITAYADRLADDLDRVDWPEKVKLMQRNWIGRSQGARVRFPVVTVTGEKADIEVFTTRPDTLFGATFMVVAPEHPSWTCLSQRAAGQRARTRTGRAPMLQRRPRRVRRRLPARRLPQG